MGFIISLAVAIFFVSGTGDWGGVPTVLLVAAFGGIIGLGGGAFGTLVVRPLLAEQAWPKPRRIKPWHVGVGVGLLEFLVAGVLSAVLA